MKFNKFSIIVFSITLFIVFGSFFKYGKEKYVFYGDALGYYSYLPSTFLLKNLDKLNELPQDKNIETPVLDYFRNMPNEHAKSPKGHYINQYTYGVALFEFPFFSIAYVIEKISGNKDITGYEKTFHWLLILATIFYSLLGSLFLFKNLNHFFDKSTALITKCLLYLASNLLWFTVIQFAMAHVILFFLYAAFIFYTIQLHKKFQFNYFLILGFILSCITLLRPTDIIAILIPLLYNVSSIKTLIEKIQLLKIHFNKIILSIVVFFIPILPQLFYWKKYAGSWLFYSYQNQGFDFKHPKIIQGLFFANNGWLLYSPLFLFCLIGLIFYKKLQPFLTSLLTLTPLYIFIIYSWWCYQYINGFGSRPMIHLYPLLAFPLAAFVFEINKRNLVFKSISILGILFFIYINLHFSYLNTSSKYWSESTNFEFYKNMMFKNNLSYNDLVIQDCELPQPKEIKTENIQRLKFVNYKNATTDEIVYDKFLKDSVVKINSGTEFCSLKIDVPIENIDLNSKYFKATCAVMFPNFLGDPYRRIKMTLVIHDGIYNQDWRGLEVFSKIGLPNNKDLANDSIKIHRGVTFLWDTLTFYVPLKKDLEKKGEVSLSLWNISKEEFYVQFLELGVLKEK